jgi:hypothetical protein
MGNVEETLTFVGTFDLAKLNEEDITHLNRSITSNEIEVEIKNFSIK